jgi:hypothetical protein
MNEKDRKAIKQAAQELIAAKAEQQLIFETVDNYQKEILKKRKFKAEPQYLFSQTEDGIITKPHQVCMLNRYDLYTYCKDCRKEERKRGLDRPIATVCNQEYMVEERFKNILRKVLGKNFKTAFNLKSIDTLDESFSEVISTLN